jgi:hypothetical protein
VAVLGLVAGMALIGGAVFLAFDNGDGGHTNVVSSPTVPTAPTSAPSSTEATGGTVIPRAPNSDADLVDWAALLARIPDVPENRSVPIVVFDYARIRVMSDVPLPPPNATDSELSTYESSIGFASPPFAPAVPTDVRTELGFDVADLDQVVQIGTAPDDLVVARGRFDPRTIADAVHSDSVWSAMLEESTYRGADVYSWGADQTLTGLTSGLRPGGESRRLAVMGDTIVWARTTATMQGAIDAIQETVPSYGHSPTIEPLTKITDEKNLIHCFVLGNAQAYASATDASAGTPVVTAPESAAVGVAIGSSSLVYYAVLLYPTEAEATAAAATLQAALDQADAEWQSLFSVTTEGTALVETLVDSATTPAGDAPLAFPPAIG